MERTVGRWPNRECWGAFVVYGTLLTLLWIVVYGGAWWITSHHTRRVRLEVDADLAIPFMPAAAIVYLSLFPMLWLAPFLLQTAERLRNFAAALAVLFLCSGLGFLLLPSEEIRPTPGPTGFFGAVFDFADLINLSHNHLPCLHVGMAVVCAHAYSVASGRLLTVGVWLWAAAIAISTLVTHQHYVADVVAGAALALVITRRQRLLPQRGRREWRRGGPG